MGEQEGQPKARSATPGLNCWPEPAKSHTLRSFRLEGVQRGVPRVGQAESGRELWGASGQRRAEGQGEEGAWYTCGTPTQQRVGATGDGQGSSQTGMKSAAGRVSDPRGPTQS